ncbi:MAG TPA: DUF6084 family protein [Polyangiaceae bacterium]|nr:DUF6084 family protein [Polyangiaceae bacterium]
MVELAFRVERAAVVEHAASPTLALAVALTTSGEPIDSVLLRSSVRLQASRRQHDAAERERLRELFGGDELWSRSPKSLLWTQATSFVPAFTGTATTDVLLPCSYDLAASAFRYLHGLRGGDVPVTVQFSGTVFHRRNGVLEVAPIAWDREASFSLPLALFTAVVDAHFPGSAVVGLRRDVFERLDGHRRRLGVRTLEETLERLLAVAEEERVA